MEFSYRNPQNTSSLQYDLTGAWIRKTKHFTLQSNTGLCRKADMLADDFAHTPTHMQKHTLFPLYHYSALPFIFPLLRVTGSKIWFPPHNSLHNAISLALNCQDNLYQSGGESTEWLNSYFSGRQEQTSGGGGQLEKSFKASLAFGYCLPFPLSRMVKPVTNHITGWILLHRNNHTCRRQWGPKVVDGICFIKLSVSSTMFSW